MTTPLTDLGYNESFEEYRTRHGLQDFDMGRVTAEHKERYIVRTANNEYESEITGNLRFTAKSRADFPAVGDWVALMPYDMNVAIIHAILPRYSIIQRKAVGQDGEIQLIAVNIDYAFLIQAANQDFNINRLERYLTICNTARVEPIVVLSKIDLIPEEVLNEIKDRIRARIGQAPIAAISNETHHGIQEIKSIMRPGKTYCMLGSSGVGKSSLLNNLSGRTVMKTDSISTQTGKGRHVSSHRELIVLEGGGILIDNPGMREVGIADTADGLELTFDHIVRIANECKYKDCTHMQEAGCAVLAAVEQGEIDPSAYENYLKMLREKNYFETSQADRKKREKQFGKMYKSHKKDIDRYKGRSD